MACWRGWGGRAGADRGERSGRLSERNLDIAEAVKQVANELGATPAQVALAWTLLNPAVVSPVLGARTLAQLQDNLAALDVSLITDQIERLNAVSQIALEFPADMWAGGRWHAQFGGVKIERRGYPGI